MDVTLKPLAASCLVEALLNEAALKSRLEEQLERVDRDRVWLGDVGARYRQAWDDAVDNGYHAELDPVNESFSLLISWLLAPLSRGSTDGLSSPALGGDANARTVAAYLAKTGASELPATERVGLYKWTVGRAVGSVDQRFPAALPAGQLPDEAELAYDGLLEHVEAAGDEPWPEIHRSAILWRLGGISQGLVPGTLRGSANTLLQTLGSHQPPPARAKGWVDGYVKDRNGFTHVLAETPDDVPFSAALGRHSDVDQVRIYLELATMFAASRINAGLLALPEQRAKALANVVDSTLPWV